MQSNFLESDFLSNRRVLIFSLTRIQSAPTFDQIKKINSLYEQLCDSNIDDVYCISFANFLLFDQLMYRLSSKIKFYQSNNLVEFQQLLNKHGNTEFLKEYWQFVCCLNNKQVEFYLEHPFSKSEMEHDTQQNIYRSVSPDVVLQKLMRV